ncbi:hypothetical protein AB2L28_14365 [Kineococcus sp. TBRC 1896]|uniref:Uncharacterized protein n=1 Tax=Kineococcus mangrovi TaxID=1660183 RepID=A0ABV4I5X9_9ACTN
MTHTTLGGRWIHDGCHDPVSVDSLLSTVVTGGREADLYAATEQGLVLEPATTRVRGSGSSVSGLVSTAPVVDHDGTTTTIDAGVRIVLPRVVVTIAAAGNGPALSSRAMTATSPSARDDRAVRVRRRECEPGPLRPGSPPARSITSE